MTFLANGSLIYECNACGEIFIVLLHNFVLIALLCILEAVGVLFIKKQPSTVMDVF